MESTARPGIARIACEAIDRGRKLAVASTSACRSVHAVLRAVVADELAAAAFAGFAGDVVPRKKPAPDIYLYTLKTLKQLAMSAENGACHRALPHRTSGGDHRRIELCHDASTFTKEESMDEALLVVTPMSRVLLKDGAQAGSGHG